MEDKITNEIDLKKLGLSFYTGEDEQKAENELISKIIPIVKGNTLNQIEKAFSKSIDLLKSSSLII